MSTTSLEAASLQYELVSPPKPKPSVDQLRQSHARFYGSIAHGFDEFNAKSTRGLYFESIDNAIAAELERRTVTGRMISVGSGTGYREQRISRLTKRPLSITCIDVCPEMCQEASKRNMEVVCSNLLEAELNAESFDACIFLNAFEVLADTAERLSYFQRIHQLLKPGGVFFVDAMDINDENDSWASLVKKQFTDERLQEFGYELGDCFSRRTDQSDIVFAHYSSKEEMEQLFKSTSFQIVRLEYFSEETGGRCEPNKGNMFYTVIKK